MKEILVISGKGGTGKTTITGAFASLADNQILVDCDVDAANLNLILQPEPRSQEAFYGLGKAEINPDKCIRCDLCTAVCRFSAITDYVVNRFRCEGCGVCAHFCPEDAIKVEPSLCGHWFISDTPYGPLVHAKLYPGEENSGKLVSKIRQAARALAEDTKTQYLLLDGPPGIGCPVISALTGVDLTFLITEPTAAGLHDLERVVRLATHFSVPMLVCINKFDLDLDTSRKIESYCSEEGIDIAGYIPFDEEVYASIAQGLPIVQYSPDSPAANAVRVVWDKVAVVANDK